MPWLMVSGARRASSTSTAPAVNLQPAGRLIRRQGLRRQTQWHNFGAAALNKKEPASRTGEGCILASRGYRPD
jgi:hypothetical protein